MAAKRANDLVLRGYSVDNDIVAVRTEPRPAPVIVRADLERSDSVDDSCRGIHSRKGSGRGVHYSEAPIKAKTEEMDPQTVVEGANMAEPVSATISVGTVIVGVLSFVGATWATITGWQLKREVERNDAKHSEAKTRMDRIDQRLEDKVTEIKSEITQIGMNTVRRDDLNEAAARIERAVAANNAETQVSLRAVHSRIDTAIANGQMGRMGM